ncbi:hypothetical protein ABZ853_28395 [Streptomyces albidoflavus]
MTATRTPTFPGRATYRQAAVVLLVSGVLAGCGLGEPDQTYQQAYDAMYPDAEAAMKEAWPEVEMLKDTADIEKCGGLDISADKNASKLRRSATYGGEVPSDDRRGLEELVRAAGERLLERGWRNGVEADIPDEGGLKFSVKSPDEVRLQLEKPGVHGWVAVWAHAYEGGSNTVSVDLATECLRNPEWKEGKDESW